MGRVDEQRIEALRVSTLDDCNFEPAIAAPRMATVDGWNVPPSRAA